KHHNHNHDSRKSSHYNCFPACSPVSLGYVPPCTIGITGHTGPTGPTSSFIITTGTGPDSVEGPPFIVTNGTTLHFWSPNGEITASTGSVRLQFNFPGATGTLGPTGPTGISPTGNTGPTGIGFTGFT